MSNCVEKKNCRQTSQAHNPKRVAVAGPDRDAYEAVSVQSTDQSLVLTKGWWHQLKTSRLQYKRDAMTRLDQIQQQETEMATLRNERERLRTERDAKSTEYDVLLKAEVTRLTEEFKEVLAAQAREHAVSLEYHQILLSKSNL